MTLYSIPRVYIDVLAEVLATSECACALVAVVAVVATACAQSVTQTNLFKMRPIILVGVFIGHPVFLTKRYLVMDIQLAGTMYDDLESLSNYVETHHPTTLFSIFKEHCGTLCSTRDLKTHF